MNELITVSEAARRLGLSRQRIGQLCKDGRIPGAVLVGRQWVIPAGAKIEALPPGRPSRTIVIPRAGAQKKARKAQKP
jgi:excisionase family DNA binding protein